MCNQNLEKRISTEKHMRNQIMYQGYIWHNEETLPSIIKSSCQFMEVLHVSLLVSSELFSESTTHYILSQLERLSENIRVDRWIRPKDCICNGDDARILAAQSSNSNCISLCNMELKMNWGQLETRKHLLGSRLSW